MHSDDVGIRDGIPADAPRLAALRFRARGGEPTPLELQELASALERWMLDHDGRSFCAVAAVGDDIVGMAWLTLVDRVPTITQHDRRSGDIQSVFVLPDSRRRHIGRRLLEHPGAKADEPRLPHVFLHSSPEAVPFYTSLGFVPSPLLLQWATDGREAPLG